MSAADKFRDELIKNARFIASPGKGILAADESTGTIGKRFANIGVENTEPNRRAYRELLFTTPGNWNEFISGVIMFEETLYQKTASGEQFVDVLKKKNVLPGIKVDKGLVVIPGTNGETATQGLDGLAGRCEQYYKQGARFAKWRATVKISDSLPTQTGINETAHTLARYAAICQQNGLVPIIEPECLMDGTHSLARCVQATQSVLAAVFKACHDQHILLEGALLKPNMVTPGHDSDEYKKVSPTDIGYATCTVLSRTVPPALPGVTFLSGGQDEEEATLNLNAINSVDIHRPWNLSFSFGRALQATVLREWKGKPENVKAAQDAFFARAQANSQAQLGKYKGGAKSTGGLYERNYKY